MEILDVIRKRRSIREYSDRAIGKEALVKMIEAARFAPTARNVQPWEFVVVTEPALLKRLAEIADHGKFIDQAKACIAVYCQDTKYYLEDGVAATQNILLEAAAQGIGSCWVAGDKKHYCPQVSALLQVSPSLKLISLIALGYPKTAGEFKIAQKRQVQEMVHWEKF